MPAHHTIDDGKHLITTTWSGEATDQECIDALIRYHRDIKSLPAYHAYDELLDFSAADVFHLSADGILRLAQIGAQADVPGVKTRLAIVVDKAVAYGLGRMYETYRSLLTRTDKEVRVFRQQADALAWLEQTSDSPSSP